MAARLVIVALLVIGVVGCSHDDAALPARSSSSSRPRPSVSPPPNPSDATDCGTSNQMAGWPSTALFPGPEAYVCIGQALQTGRRAQLVIISPGTRNSGRKTSDGYELPTKLVRTWVVLGKHRVRQITDQREDGGPRTTEVCTGLRIGAPGSIPVGTGCG